MDRNYKNEESALRVKDLGCYLLEKRKNILIGTIIIGLLFSAFSIYKNYLSYKNQEDEQYLKKNVDVQRRQYVEGVATQSVYYKKLIDSENAYINNSVYMSLDWKNTAHLTLQYEVELNEGYSSVENKLQLLLKTYESKIKNDSFYNTVSENTNIEKNDIVDMISVSQNIPGGTTISINENNGATQITTQANEENNNQEYIGILTVIIIGPDTQFCKSVENYVTSTIEQSQESIANEIGQHTIRLISDSIVTSADDAVRLKQTNMLSTVDANQKSLDALTTGLSSDETSYVNYIVNKNTNSLTSNVKIFRLKQISMSFWDGLVLMILYWFMKYLYCKRLISIYTIEDVYAQNTYVLDTKDKLSLNKSNSKIEKFRYNDIHIYSASELVDMITALILEKDEPDKSHKVCLVSSDLSVLDPKMLDNITKCFASNGIILECGDHISFRPETIQKIGNSDYIITIERINKSVLTDIDAEMKYLFEKKVDVLGSIVVL